MFLYIYLHIEEHTYSKLRNSLLFQLCIYIYLLSQCIRLLPEKDLRDLQVAFIYESYKGSNRSPGSENCQKELTIQQRFGGH